MKLLLMKLMVVIKDQDDIAGDEPLLPESNFLYQKHMFLKLKEL